MCASNLLRTVRSEVPYDRVKGLDPRLIDQPIATVDPEIRQDAMWVLETYEPRAVVKGIIVGQSDGTTGAFNVTASISKKEA